MSRKKTPRKLLVRNQESQRDGVVQALLKESEQPIAPPDKDMASTLCDEAALPTPALESLQNPLTVPLNTWQLSGAAVKGLAHWRKDLPCQDAVRWRAQPRPILLLSDGAGSASVSELGAEVLVTGIARFLSSMEDALRLWMDAATGQEQEQVQQWSHRLLLHAQGLLEDLAQSERRKVSELRATLLLAVLGTVHSFWWQVGDGVIVAQSNEKARVLGDSSKSKGEFANQTCFVDTASLEDLQFGVLPTADLLGLALMSDGGAERLVANDGSQVAARVNNWLEALRQKSFSPEQLAVAFHEPEMWQRTSLDDRSIVLAARPRQAY